MFLVLLAFAAYFLPAIVGWNKKASGGILVLNLFLGWTVIGWIIALAWALASDPAPTHVLVYQTGPTAYAPGSYCPSCGSYLAAVGRFCSRCGARTSS